MKRDHATIRVECPGILTAKEKGRLLKGIQEFVRLGDTIEDYQRFAQEWPDFFPAAIPTFDLPGEAGDDEIFDICIAWAPVCHKLVLVYRDCLRRLWRMEPEVMRDESLPLLLGISEHLQGVDKEDMEHLMPESGTGFPLLHRWGRWGQAMREVFKAHPHAWIFGATLRPSWEAEDFTYTPRNNFQRAVYRLFRERWRARICYRCGTLFVADRPPQMYCSARCFAETKRVRDLNWRRRERSKRREPHSVKRIKKGE